MTRAAAGFRQRVCSREPMLGTIVTLPSPEVAELLAGAGFDWLFIDMEHGLIDGTAAHRIVQAVAGACACVVRVPCLDAAWIAKALDTGADGVIVPHVERADQADLVVSAGRYAPEGCRSIGVARANAYGRHLAEDLAGGANRRVAVIAQAEHVAAVKAIDEVAGAEGLDGVFIGPFDLSASLGRPGQIADHAVQEAIGHVRAACERHRVACGILVTDAAAAEEAFVAGDSLVCVGTDTLLLGRVASDVVQSVRTRGNVARQV
jgi:2-dehydro-3-deoxyglucarate aldolase/4-hydroxy-2-oxoheptanedioate aldolase